MNWKSTALISGATVVATWLASSPTVRPPAARVNAPVRDAGHSAEAAADIVREADRLREKLGAAAVYHEPARNPFRFGPIARPRAANPVSVPPASAAAPIAPEPHAMLVSLAGIAEETTGDQVVRTAVISTPDGVVLAKAGATIAGQYLVVSIAADSVELTRTADGQAVRLALRP